MRVVLAASLAVSLSAFADNGGTLGSGSKEEGGGGTIGSGTRSWRRGDPERQWRKLSQNRTAGVLAG